MIYWVIVRAGVGFRVGVRSASEIYSNMEKPCEMAQAIN